MMGAAALVAAVMISIKWTDGGRYLGWRPFSPAALAAIRSSPDRLYNTLYEGGLMIWFVPERRVYKARRSAGEMASAPSGASSSTVPCERYESAQRHAACHPISFQSQPSN
jgi:hypothetical protein